jgi:Fic family protein
MRDRVAAVFADRPVPHAFAERPLQDILDSMDHIYVTDAYHSLSIEGYQVTPELIQRVSRGDGSPGIVEADRDAKDALAAKGYHLAFLSVEESIKQAHEAESIDLNVLLDLGIADWYGNLFSPCVDAGIVDRVHLAGYRKGPMYIRGSRHVPPPSDQLTDCMDALRDLIVAEPDAAVRATLGHLFLGFIHPFFDGNGRTARFLMNFLLVVAGNEWLVVRVEDREAYLAALEQASVYGDPVPFALFVRNYMAMY